jgi:uncharacterized protein (DUF697 family)
MSFTNSGIPGPGFSYPVGVGVFTDVIASNTVFTSFVRGDGGFLSNVNSSIPGTLPNLVISNSLTVTNVFATIYQGDGANLVNLNTTSVSNSGQLDITAGPYTWTYGSDGTFNLPSSAIGMSIIQTPLSAMDLTVGTQTWAFNSTGEATFPGTITADGGLLSNLTVYGNTISNIQASNIVGLNVVYGNTLSNLNASNLAFGLVGSSLILGNTISNIQSSNVIGIVDPTRINGNTLSNLNASNLAFGVVASSRIYGNTLSNIQSANITQPFTNLVVSNTLTTTNVVAAGFTSNLSNTVFNYTTLSVPYINCTSINVTTTATYATVNTTNMLVTGSMGFATITGTGGAVTQLTSRNTGVTLNKPCGTITLFSSAINSQASNTFTLTNSYIASSDFVIINHVSGQTPGAYTFAVDPNAGTANITLRNVSGGTLTAGAPVLQFIVIKSTNA